MPSERHARGRFFAIFGVLVSVGLLVLLGVLGLNQEKRLLARGKPLARLPHPEALEADTRFWLDDQGMLIATEIPRSQPGTGSLTHFSRWNIHTGEETPYGALNDRARNLGGGEGYYLSPDRKWLLWSTQDAAYAVTLDAARIVRYQEKTAYNGNLCWLGDSRHWAVFENDANRDRFIQARMYSVDAAKPLRTLTFSPSIPQESGCFGSIDTMGGSPDHLLGDTGCWSGDDNKDEIIEMALTDSVVSAHRYAIKLPPKAMLQSTAYAPQGDRVAWIVRIEYTPPLSDLLRRFLPMIRVQTRSVAAIWVSRLDGSQMHEIGHINLLDEDTATGSPTTTPTGIMSPELLNVAWLPDGKRLSFVYDGRLWTVSAD